jgi:uncharacterized protein YbjT (DUF2867 family)
VLLTGATGFVGRHMLPALRAAGWQVRCTSRRPVAARSANRTWNGARSTCTRRRDWPERSRAATPRCTWCTGSQAQRRRARELVEGLTSDLIARDYGVFAHMPGHRRTDLDAAIHCALDDERSGPFPGAGARRRMERIGAACA